MEQLSSQTEQQHLLRLSKRLNDMRLEQRLTDVTLICENDEKLAANRSILAACSPYFSNLFEDAKWEADRTVELRTIKSCEMEVLLEFMYTGNIPLKESELEVVCKLLPASIYLQLDAVVDFCSEALSHALSPTEFYEFWQSAESLKNENMKSKVVSFLAKNLVEVQMSPDFTKLPVECLTAVLSQEELQLEADDAMQGLITWLSEDTPNRSQHVQILLSHIDSKSLSDDTLLNLQQSSVVLQSMELMRFVFSSVADRYRSVRSLHGSSTSLASLQSDVTNSSADKIVIPVSRASTAKEREKQAVPSTLVPMPPSEVCAKLSTAEKMEPKTDRQLTRIPNTAKEDTVKEQPKGAAAAAKPKGQRTVADLSLLTKNRKKDQPLNQHTSLVKNHLSYSTVCNGNGSNQGGGQLTDCSISSSTQPPEISSQNNNVQSNGRKVVSVKSIEEADYSQDVFMVMKDNRNQWSLQTFCTKNDSWGNPKTIGRKLYEKAAIVGVGSTIFFVGGKTESWNVIGTVLKYDISSENWQQVSDLQMARCKAGGGELEGYVYAVGGVGTINTRLNQMERYNIQSQGKWEMVAPLGTCREQPSVTGMRGKLYVIGGYVVQQQQWKMRVLPTDRVAPGDVYDPTTNQWTELDTTLPLGRDVQERVFCTAAWNGKLFAIRHQSRSQGQPMGQPGLFQYDLQANSWSRFIVSDSELSDLIRMDSAPGGLCIVSSKGSVYMFNPDKKELEKCCNGETSGLIFAVVPTKAGSGLM